MWFTRKSIRWSKCVTYKNSCIWVHRTDVRWQTFALRKKAEIHMKILNKTWRWCQAIASLRLGLPAPQPSRRCHAQSLLSPSFQDPRTHHVLESYPDQAAPLSLRDDERRHDVGSHSALALSLYLAACNPSSSCHFWVLDHLCSNLSQSFQLCWITEPVCVFLPFPLLPLLFW